MVNARFLTVLAAVVVLLVYGCLPKREIAGGQIEEHAEPHRYNVRDRVILSDASDAPALKTPHRSRNTAQLVEAYARVLGVPARDLRNPQLYIFIDEWMGTPHRTAGKGRGGIDCSAFTGLLLQKVYGKQVPRTSAEMGEIVKRKYERQLREGDLVFFSFGPGNRIDHVGVYLANGKFVHVSSRRGVIISRLRDSWYYRHFTRCGSV